MFSPKKRVYTKKKNVFTKNMFFHQKKTFLPTKTIGSKWVPMFPNGIKLVKMGPNGSKWVQMGSTLKNNKDTKTLYVMALTFDLVYYRLGGAIYKAFKMCYLIT